MHLKSSHNSRHVGDNRPSAHRRVGQAEWRGSISASFLRGRGPDHRQARSGWAAALPAQHPAAGGIHSGRSARRTVTKRGTACTGSLARKQNTQPLRLGRAVPRLARPARRPDPRAAASAGRADGLHRLRLPVAHTMPAIQPGRRSGWPWSWRSLPPRRERFRSCAPRPRYVSSPEQRARERKHAKALLIYPHGFPFGGTPADGFRGFGRTQIAARILIWSFALLYCRLRRG